MLWNCDEETCDAAEKQGKAESSFAAERRGVVSRCYGRARLWKATIGIAKEWRSME